MIRSRNLFHLTLAAVFAALVFIAVYLLKIPLQFAGSSINLGDAFIYLAAALLPTPWAAAAGAVGAALADAVSPGGMAYVPSDLIIKTLLVLWFTSRRPNILCLRNGLAVLFAGLTGIVGYYFTDVILYGNWVTPLVVDFGFGSIQPAVCGALFLLVSAALDRAGFKRRLLPKE